MKKLKLILVCVVMLIFNINAQATKPKSIILIDGYFFCEMPISKQEITKMHMLQTPNGVMALGLEVAKPLSEEAIKLAISKNDVPEAEWLLQRYNEVKSDDNGVTLAISRTQTLKVGDKYPAFKASDINGKQWTEADIKGKVAVFNLWFSGCGPCRAEMPELSTWKNEMPDAMFFSSTYESADVALPIIEKSSFNWIHLVDNEQFKELIGSNGYPMTIVVDKAGVITMIEYGTSPTQRTKLKEEIRKLIEQ